MRLRPSLLVLPVLGVALLSSGCFQSSTAGTVSSPITVNVGTTQTAVNPAAGATSTAATSTSTSGTSTAGTSTGGAAGGTPSYPPAAKAMFTQTCGGCHTLANAGTTGTVGPNLDQLKPSLATVEHQIANGGGPMPAGLFKGQAAVDVAEYVSSVAGKGGSSSGGSSVGGAP